LPDRDTTAFASFPSGAAGGGPARFRKAPGRRGVTFQHNQADFGGGIYNDDDLVISDSRTMRNSATSDGGGIYNDDTVTPTNSLWTENRPDNCAGNSVAGCTD
jgi:predicted outer membrane repeat protein